MAATYGPRIYEVRFSHHFDLRLAERVPAIYHRRIRSEVRKRLNAALRTGVQPYGVDLNVIVRIGGIWFEEDYGVICVPDAMGYWVAKTILFAEDGGHEQRGVS